MIFPKKTAPAAEHSLQTAPRRGPRQLVALSLLLGACTGSRPELPEDLRAEAIVVLGNRPPTDKQGRVMPETERRVRRGVELYRGGRAPVLVMTGGPAPRGEVEAEVMRALALELDVPEEAIRVETESRDTIENARFTKKLLSSDGAAEHRPQVILVTSPFHLERARRLFDCAGFDVEPVASEPPPRVFDRMGLRAYEVMVAIYYAFIDECAQSRDAAR